MLKKVYLEITNVCNLACAFCPGTRRAAGAVSPEGFRTLVGRLEGRTKLLYFHLMGEPLLHPRLGELLSLSADAGLPVAITTNGTLLSRAAPALLSAPALRRVNVSLQAHEANRDVPPLEAYVLSCAAFALLAAERGVVCTLRLWNRNGQAAQNGEILSLLRQAFPPPWPPRGEARMLAPRVFLQEADRFDWPAPEAAEAPGPRFCRGLRDQVGVLWDGTVVPCCLDGEGRIPLGNLYRQSLEEILASPRARAIYDGFSRREAVEPLCRRCGYARRFDRT